MKKKKIFQFTPFAFENHQGGVEKISSVLHKGLEGNDFTITTICYFFKGGSVPEGYIGLPSIQLFGTYPLPCIFSKKFRLILKEIIDEKPTFVLTHTRFFTTSLLGGLISKFTKAKRFHIEHGSGFVKGYPLYIMIFAFLYDVSFGLLIFRYCDILISINEANKKFISKFTLKKPVVVYNPIDFTPKKRTKRDNDFITIGFVGRLVQLKGVDLLIEALSFFDTNTRKCIIVGEGPERTSLEKQVTDLGLENNIIFVGAQNREEWLHKFDIFVNPSHQEGLPTTVVESLLAGCLTVATDVGGTNEISISNNIIIVRPNSVKSLRIGIEKAKGLLHENIIVPLDVIKRFSSKEVIKKYKVLFNPHQ